MGHSAVCFFPSSARSSVIAPGLFARISLLWLMFLFHLISDYDILGPWIEGELLDSASHMISSEYF